MILAGAHAGGAGAAGSLAWLAGMSVAAIVIAALQRGLTRVGGAVIVLLYAGFLGALLQAAR